MAQQLRRLAEEVFKNRFVDAMHPTLVRPIAIVLRATLSCLAIEHRKYKAQPEPAERQPEKAP